MNAMGGENLSGAQKEELMGQVKQQIAVANAQELLQKMTEKCFKKCISKPGYSLDSSEQKCIAMCMDRYMDSWNLVSKTYSGRLQRERNQMLNWDADLPQVCFSLRFQFCQDVIGLFELVIPDKFVH